MYIKVHVTSLTAWSMAETTAVLPKASIHLKIWGVQLPLSCPPLPFPSSSLPSFPLSLPLTFPCLLSFPFPGGPPPKPARGSGEHCKLPQWGLRWSPSRQTIWCISGPKGAAPVTTVFVDFHKNKLNFLHKHKTANTVFWCILQR